jgi:hypothetical protein
VEEKTKLIVAIAFGIVALIVILAIGIDPYFTIVPIALFEIAYFVYVGILGRTNAIILQKKFPDSSYWSNVFVIIGVSHDKRDGSFSYDSIFHLQSRRMEKKWSPYSLRGLQVQA